MGNDISRKLIFESEEFIKERIYWQEKLANRFLDNKSQYIRTKNKIEGKEIKSICFQLEEDLATKLIKLSSNSDKNLFVALLSGVMLLTKKYIQMDEILVGCPIYGELAKEDIMNGILVLKNNIAQNMTFKQFLLNTRQELNESIKNQNFPVIEVLKSMGKCPKESNESPLQYLCFLKNIQTKEYIRDINYNLCFGFERIGSSIVGEIFYDSRFFDENIIKYLICNLEHILNMLLTNLNGVINQNNLISEVEYGQIVMDAKGVLIDIPDNNTICSLFEEQVKKYPERIALTYENTQVTYRELNEKANRIARYLLSKGMESNEIVGVMMKKSVDVIICIVGILKAGGAYLPIMESLPESRKKYILNNSGARILLADSEVLDGFYNEIKIFNTYDGIQSEYSIGNLENVIKPQDMAYVIYTSGSTGMPKGVIVEHRNVVNLVAALSQEVFSKYKGVLNVALVAPYVFDASVQQIFASLLLGHNLCIVPDEVRKDGNQLIQYLVANNIDISDGTPTHIKLMANDANPVGGKLNVKHFIIGGELLRGEDVRRFFWKFPDDEFELLNIYGLTECCVDSTAYSITRELAEGLVNTPIGKPLANQKVYILGEDLTVLPTGAVGEICILGENIGRGYINNPELNKEKFITSPFDSSEIMFRTGDFGRRNIEGDIEFLGRMDNQVKIRGYRVDLSEIESSILKYPGIKEAVVSVRADNTNENYLVAYIVVESVVKWESLRAYLLDFLPEYTIPSHCIHLDSLPYTNNGKVDRKALMNMDKFLLEGDSLDAAEDEIEEKLIEICKEKLNHENIGVNSNFFNVGGHSLNATLMAGKIKNEFNIDFSVSNIFELQTIRKIAKYIRTAKYQENYSIVSAEVKPVYKLSAVQTRLYSVQQLNPESTAYNMPLAVELHNDFNSERLRSAIKKIIQRHEILRTSFKVVNGEIVQLVKRDAYIDLEVIELAKEVSEAEIENIIKAQVKPFDLSESPLFRVVLVKLTGARNILIFDMHHIISDGMSMKILIDEFFLLYNNENEILKELRYQYKDFSEWQNQWIESEFCTKQETYWMNTLSDEIPVLDIPYDYKRAMKRNFNGDQLWFELDKKTTDDLKKLSIDTDTTMFMVFVSIMNVFLEKLTGQEDIIIGYPIAGRHQTSFENVVGPFINTLVCRNFPKSGKRFQDFLEEVKVNVLNAFENQDYPFDMLVNKLGVGKESSRNPIFDVAITMENIHTDTLKEFDLSFKPYILENKIAKFDLMLFVKEFDDHMALAFEYSTDLFRRETIESFAKGVKQIISKITKDKTINLGFIDLISEEERLALISPGNHSQINYPRDKTINEIFEEHAKNMPNKVAVVFEDQKVTYKELNEKANALARTLRKKGLKSESVIGVLVHKSVEMIIAILGTLKAGGAYMPIDPDYPKERIDYMLEDSGVEILLSHLPLIEDINYDKCVIDLYDMDTYEEESRDLENINQQNNLAYIIYTSGTTGKPKGVMIEHRNVISLVLNETSNFEFSDNDTWTMFHSLCFDFSVWEIYGALLYGGTLVVVPKYVTQSPQAFSNLLRLHGVTVLNQTPTAFNNLIVEEDLNIKRIIFGGEALKPALLKGWKLKYPNTKLINMYGITETTVHVTYKEITDNEIESNISNIGKPIPTASIYLVDKDLNLVPDGVRGEILVGGEGVGRGYLNRPDLSEQRFLSSPYVVGERVYRSGDLARRLPNGEFKYEGRIDHQVKIRGFRIELDEIENNVLKHENVSEAVVVVKEDEGNLNYLCAYIICKKALDIPDLIEFLKQILPEYMIPAYFVELEKIPLTSNGKVNKKILPDPKSNLRKHQKEVSKPRNLIEERLVEIWEEVLGLKNISITDNFFYIGGDSIKAIQIAARLSEYGYKLDVKDIFASPEIIHLSKKVNNKKRIVEQNEIVGEVAFTPIQRYFFEKNSNLNHFNQSVMLFNKNGFDDNLIKKVFSKISEHHDVFRMVFDFSDGEIVQFNRGVGHCGFELEVFDYRLLVNVENKIVEECNRLQKSIDLEQGPLIKMGLFKTKEGDHLAIIIHHLVIDGVSWRILLEDFSNGYTMALENRTIKFPRKTSSYMQWAKSLQTYSSSEALLNENEYWTSMELLGYERLFDEQQELVEVQKQKTLTMSLSEEQTEKLLTETNKAYNTKIDEILLIALGLTMKKITNKSSIIVNLEGHGREELFDDVDVTRTIGWFTSIYPIALVIDNETHISSQIKAIKEIIRQVPSNGVGYGMLKYLSEDPVANFNIKPEICFNYLGTFDKAFSNDLFELSRLSSGSNISTENENNYAININGVTKSNCLLLNFSFSSKQFDDEEMERTIRIYKEELLGVIEHCVNKQGVELTPSDLESTLITQSELDDFMMELDDINV